MVVITGSSRGIGKTTAGSLLAAGARVVINGRDPEILEKTCDEFRRLGFQPLAIVGDMSDFRACEKLLQRTVEHFGRIDILINNAGIGFRGRMENTAPPVFKSVIDANLMTAIYSTRAALDQIKLTKGSIIFISSLSGIRATPENGPYNIAKMGLTALAQTLRLELYGTGVHIGIIMVGLTEIDQDKKVIACDGSIIPLHRHWHQTKEEVASKIMMVIRKRKSSVILTPLGKLDALLQKISPSAVEWIIRKSHRSDKFNS